MLGNLCCCVVAEVIIYKSYVHLQISISLKFRFLLQFVYILCKNNTLV